MYYPKGMKARVSLVQWSKPYSILVPTQDSNLGGRIQNHKQTDDRPCLTEARVPSFNGEEVNLKSANTIHLYGNQFYPPEI